MVMTEKNEVRASKNAIENLPLPAPGKRFDRWWVAGVPGLCVRVMSTGIKSFLFVRRVGHRTTEITLGKFPAMTPDQAKRMAAEMNAQTAQGVDPADEIRVRRAEMTMAEAFDLYLERHAKVHKRTWKEDIRRWRIYLAKELGTRKVSDISRRDIAALHANIGRKGKRGDGSPYEANRTLALVSIIFSKLLEWELAEKNPATGISKFKEVKRDRFLKSNELPNFFKALAALQNEDAMDFFLLLLLTGARKSNVLAMAWRDVDLSSKTWRIPVTKNGEPQTVALCPQACQILEQRRSRAMNLWVFASGNSSSGHMEEPKKPWANVRRLVSCYRLIAVLAEKQTWTEEQIEQAEYLAAKVPAAALTQFVSDLEKLGIEIDVHKTKNSELVGDDIRIHDLRRTLGSWQAMTGASLTIIGKSLNHKSHQSTAIYARLDMDPVRHAVETATAAIFDSAFAGIAGGKPYTRAMSVTE